MITKPIKVFCFVLLGFTTLTLLHSCAYPTPPPTHEQVKEQMVGDMIRGTTPMERATYLTNIMSTKLQLNELQQVQVAKLNLDYSRRFSTLMNSTNQDISKHDEFLRLSAEKEGRLLSILSESQARAYIANKYRFLDNYRIM